MPARSEPCRPGRLQAPDRPAHATANMKGRRSSAPRQGRSPPGEAFPTPSAGRSSKCCVHRQGRAKGSCFLAMSPAPRQIDPFRAQDRHARLARANRPRSSNCRPAGRNSWQARSTTSATPRQATGRLAASAARSRVIEVCRQTRFINLNPIGARGGQAFEYLPIDRQQGVQVAEYSETLPAAPCRAIDTTPDPIEPDVYEYPVRGPQ